MASTKVIATTWAKKDLVTKLKATLKRMDDEIVAWEKDNATLEKRQQAWDKKAVAWAIKNMSKAKDTDSCMYHNRFQLSISFDTQLAEDALGIRPFQDRKPDYKGTNYSKDESDYSQVENALALIEGSTDVEYKINTSSVWASFIR
jgi:hypothetical protein